MAIPSISKHISDGSPASMLRADCRRRTPPRSGRLPR
jgi:hypothetical protein